MQIFVGMRPRTPTENYIRMSIIAITAYFNPFKSQRRENVFNTFRSALKSLGIPLLCVEQRFSHITPITGPTDILIEGGALLWQKECLLQIGIDQALTSGYDNIIICDADIIFRNRNIKEIIEQSLTKYDFIQPFDTIVLEYDDGSITRSSVLNNKVLKQFGSGHPGSCWAATADFCRNVRLYPYAILGGGDVVMSHLTSLAIKYSSLSPRFLDFCYFYANNVLYPSLFESIITWATQFESKSFRLGCLPGIQLLSLSHGSRFQRKYESRYNSWRGHTANIAPRPGENFTVGANGLIEWISGREEWNNLIYNYFKQREQTTL